MKRYHGFEFNDQAFLPDFLRRNLTGFLQTLFSMSHRFTPSVAKAISKKICSGLGERSSIVDLCSGSGGLWPSLLPSVLQEAKTDIIVTLTDLYPNKSAFNRIKLMYPQHIDFSLTPTNAAQVPENQKGMRTIFEGIHHMRPEIAEKIVADAVKQRQPIYIFDVTGRNLPFILWVVLILPIAILLCTPFIRPFDWRWIITTYIFPISVFMIVWDGVVSCLRTYTTKELMDMAEKADPEQTFYFETGSLLPGKLGFVWMLGVPKGNVILTNDGVGASE